MELPLDVSIPPKRPAIHVSRLLLLALTLVVLALVAVVNDPAIARSPWGWLLVATNLATLAFAYKAARGARRLPHSGATDLDRSSLQALAGRVASEGPLASSAHADREVRALGLPDAYTQFFDRTTDALMVLADNRFIEANPACLGLFACATLEEFLGTHPSDLSPPSQPDGRPSREKADEMIRGAIETGSRRFEWVHRTRQGTEFPAEVLLVTVGNRSRPLVCAVVREISDRKKAEAEIRFQAYYDSLTGLPNRRLMMDRINQTLTSSRRHQYLNALLFVDLDRFKLVNDSLGHSVGDELLMRVAESLRQQLRDEDTVARFGGDEFVVLLKHLDADRQAASLRAERLAEALQQSISRTYTIDAHSVHVTSSIGIYIFPDREEGLDDIIKQADTAMYSAKEKGRNQIAFFQAAMQDTIIKRLTLEKDLRQAVLNRELQVYFQPQVSADRETIGVEALARWQHPERGFVPPDEFIAIAEDCGVIYELGDWVLNHSIEQWLSLPRRPSQLSVNISPYQFRHPEFVASIEQVLQRYQFAPRSLVLEITEGVVISDFQDAVERLQQLRHLGVRIALDDFGTGYSSLSYLKRLPIDEIKIDRSFVMDVDQDPQDAQLVQTIINIAHQFDLVTVAEGVENEAQLEFLRNQDCRLYQGYLFSRPVPVAELIPFMAEHDTSA